MKYGTADNLPSALFGGNIAHVTGRVASLCSLCLMKPVSRRDRLPHRKQFPEQTALLAKHPSSADGNYKTTRVPDGFHTLPS